MYRTLDADKIITTASTLIGRINDRFPESGLVKVARELAAAGVDAKARAPRLGKPNAALRLAVAAGVIAGAAMFAWFGSFLNFSRIPTEAFGLVQGIEALVNTLILAGFGVFFLFTVEDRIKRQRALRDLHELRSIIHVVDMHQLTKDPSVLVAEGPPAAHSPRRTMTRFELVRYLDYCSEMLSIAAKFAALYAQSFPDPVVVNAVNDVEVLSTNLSRKIWQKIMLVAPAGTMPGATVDASDSAVTEAHTH